MLPVVMAGRLGVSLAFTGSIFVLLTAGMFLAGPFYSYLMDTYKRKYICLLSFAIMLLVNAACLFVQTPVEFMLLCLIHGISFGLATTTSITLAIDLTNPGKRSASNVVFVVTSRFGMMMGVAACIAVFMYRGFD
jgi:MFS family permease